MIDANRRMLSVTAAPEEIYPRSEEFSTEVALKQYARLEGIVAGRKPDARHLPGHTQPVENPMAPHATVAQNDSSSWHVATVARGATVERYAMVRGELRVPNTVNFRLFPTLDPFAKAVYYQLFLLSHGFRKDTCLISLAKLSTLVLMSQRKVQNTITYLEKRGLIRRLESKLGGSFKGVLYQVPLLATETEPMTTMAQDATVAHGAILAPDATLARSATEAGRANNKEKYDDDYIKIKSSSNGAECESDPVEDHTGEATPPERECPRDRHLLIVRAGYEKATGNRWNKSDSEAYQQSRLKEVPLKRIISTLEAVVRRTPSKINSLRYFLKEIKSVPDPRNRAWQKKRLEKIVHRIRDNAVGRDYSLGDFVEDVKRACAREDVTFDNDIFNEIVS